jgi:tRNA A37 threonylcarbamoyladenosine modification protein TsaB
VSSADCLAAQASQENLAKQVSVVIDAQRGEFYLASYSLGDGKWRGTSPLRLASAEEVRARETAGDLLIGPEVQKWFPSGRTLYPQAGTVAKLAACRNDFVAGEALEPIYLREARFVKAPSPRTFS